MNANPGRLAAGLLFLLWAMVCVPQAADNSRQAFQQHLEKARAFIAQKQPALAIPELEAAAEIDPDDVEAQGNLGVLLYFQGKISEAVPHLRIAVERQPSLAKIQGILGIAELRTQDFTRGRKDLETALPLIADEKFKVQVGLELVGLYTQSGDLELAAAILSQLRKTAPDNPEVLYAAYRTYSELSGEAMLALSLAAPDSAEMHQLLAHEETREGNTNRAIAEYRKAIAIDPHLPGVHFELADLLNTSQNPAVKLEAEQEFRAALNDNPQDEKAICSLAEIAAHQGNAREAYDEYSKAVALAPADADAKLGLAKAMIAMGQSEKALPVLESVVELEPTDALAHYRLATLYQKAGRTDDARREAELYKKYKAMKDKLHAVYQDLLIEPKEIRAQN
jgi:Tfp pilus assembly protein PilF